MADAKPEARYRYVVECPCGYREVFETEARATAAQEGHAIATGHAEVTAIGFPADRVR